MLLQSSTMHISVAPVCGTNRGTAVTAARQLEAVRHQWVDPSTMVAETLDSMPTASITTCCHPPLICFYLSRFSTITLKVVLKKRFMRYLSFFREGIVGVLCSGNGNKASHFKSMLPAVFFFLYDHHYCYCYYFMSLLQLFFTVYKFNFSFKVFFFSLKL